MNANTRRVRLPAWGWAWVVAGLAAPLSSAQTGSSAAGQSVAPEVISWWRFDEGRGNRARDEGQERDDPVHGSFEYVPGIRGTALKLDGFRTHVRRERNDASGLDGAFTAEGWIALASYPWSWAPIVDCSVPRTKGFFLGVGPQGNVGFRIAAGSSWYEATSRATVPLREWTHVAAVFEPDESISIFLNGEEVASVPIDGNYVPARRGALTIGRTNTPQIWREFQLTTKNSWFFLDGLVDEIRISDGAKTEVELGAEVAAVVDPPAPALSHRERLPTGPRGSGSFGAFHTRLDYYEEWDDLWRVGGVPDLFVRFDRSPVQLVFWRGTSFVPCWVTENGIWYTNEWLETWGDDVASCAEPIMDRQCRYSHVRLIEDTPARVVIHWRYALCDAFYDFAAVGDDGRGEWCDEYHTIYPDQVGVRRMELHYSRPERKHDWVEQIVVLPPGKVPDDVIEREAISLVNMAGEVQGYSWNDDLEVEMAAPAGANMSLVHLKSRYRPFFILPPDPVETIEGEWNAPFFRSYAAAMAKGYRQDPVPSVYGWWNHWPVAQIPGDGRWVTTPDRPSHFNLTTFVQWKDHAYTERTRTRIMLQGMTELEPDGLVSLARSWLQAPAMKLVSEGYEGGNYDPSERAYLVRKADPSSTPPLELVVGASPDSPLLNPAIIVENWGQEPVSLSVDGVIRAPGKDFRQGIRKRPLGEDLILWIGLASQQPVVIAIQPTGGK